MAPDGFAKPMMVVNGQYPGPVSRMIGIYAMFLTLYRPLLRIGETTLRLRSRIILKLTVRVSIGTALGNWVQMKWTVLVVSQNAQLLQETRKCTSSRQHNMVLRGTTVTTLFSTVTVSLEASSSMDPQPPTTISTWACYPSLIGFMLLCA
jgi:hypothetical protein